MTLAEELLDSTVETYAGQDVEAEQHDYEALKAAVGDIYGVDVAELETIPLEGLKPEEVSDALWPPILTKYERKEALLPTEILRRVERDIMLQIVDSQWKDHLYSLDHLKEGIGLRGYGQKDPLVEYKKESFALFTAMKDRIEEEIVRYLWRLTPVIGEEGAEPPAPVRQPAPRRPPHAHAERAVTGARALAVRRDPEQRLRRRGRRTAAPGADRRRRFDPAGQARRAEGRPQRSRAPAAAGRIQEMPRGVTRATVPVHRAPCDRRRQAIRGSNDGCCPFRFEG